MVSKDDVVGRVYKARYCSEQTVQNNQFTTSSRTAPYGTCREDRRGRRRCPLPSHYGERRENCSERLIRLIERRRRSSEHASGPHSSLVRSLHRHSGQEGELGCLLQFFPAPVELCLQCLSPLAKRSVSGCHGLGTSAECVLLSGCLGHRVQRGEVVV